jgi:hypothetical protein
MIVEDLIRVLQTCNPRAVVLIPRENSLGDGAETVVEVTPLTRGQEGAVRLSGFASVFAGGSLNEA